MAQNKGKSTPSPAPSNGNRRPIHEDRNRTGTFDHREIRKQERGTVVMPRDQYTPDPPPKKGGK